MYGRTMATIDITAITGVVETGDTVDKMYKV